MLYFCHSAIQSSVLVAGIVKQEVTHPLPIPVCSVQLACTATPQPHLYVRSVLQAGTSQTKECPSVYSVRLATIVNFQAVSR